MSIEEKDAYDTCLQANDIVFTFVLPSKDCRALSKLAYYLLDQGLRASIAKEIFSASSSAGKDDKKNEHEIETAFKKQQASMWEDFMTICSQRMLKDADSEHELKPRGASELLTELIRVDLKGRADGRQIRNIDLKKRVQTVDETLPPLDEQIASAEKSSSTAAKNRMFGVLPKTLVPLCKAVKAGSPKADRLIQTVVLSVC